MAFVKNEYVLIDGTLSWARLIVPEEYEGDKFWSITIHPNSDSLEKVRDLQARGIMNKMKKDDDGYFIKFKRPLFKKTKTGIIPFQPPVCFNKEKELIDGGKIGNGSTGSLKLECYGADKPRRYFAARLDSIMVYDLIEYVPQRDLQPADRSAAEGHREGAEPIW